MKRKGKVGERKGGGGVGKEVKPCKNREERKAEKSRSPFSLTIEKEEKVGERKGGEAGWGRRSSHARIGKKGRPKRVALPSLSPLRTG